MRETGYRERQIAMQIKVDLQVKMGHGLLPGENYAIHHDGVLAHVGDSNVIFPIVFGNSLQEHARLFLGELENSPRFSIHGYLCFARALQAANPYPDADGVVSPEMGSDVSVRNNPSVSEAIPRPFLIELISIPPNRLSWRRLPG
eukprot:CAMPEP_0184680690 /NCGR_PEP_ID=MMETSP0312-20130426/3584_1 /TAXON_ID=31354 /ORGANISM="Compsopogon coeruleus, Strain SAG 36.94" /LENGTH=144 /DNA_ID=CAMNT_0027130969 /DNA_START=36 /DNA_END=470 /DNA_ORIENTATION=-